MTKKEIAYEKIRNDIFCRNLLPGSKININQLAKSYDMSPIPVREALTLLETENLVSNIPYQGFIVSNVIFNDFLEYSLIRNEMECLALRYGIAYLTDESLDHIKELHQRLIELYKSGNREEYVLVNKKFYKSLYSFAPCQKLLELIDDMTRKAYHSQSLLLLLPSRMETSLEEHASLIKEIEARNTERACEILFSQRLNTLLVLVREMKYSLMKPNYEDEEILYAFFSQEKLKERSAISGEVEYWIYILENLSSTQGLMKSDK